MRLLALLAGVFALVIVSPVAAAGTAAWPQVGGDVRHSGANLLEREIGKCNAGTLGIRWSQPIGRAPQGAPSLAGGRVFVGSGDGFLHALDALTGKPIWSKPLGGRLATPVVDGTRVYALTGTDSSYGMLYALETGDGREVWRRSVNANGHQSPVVGNGQVVISSNRLYGFSVDTGQQIWTYGDDTGVAYEPAIVNGLVVAADDGKLVALAPSGQEVWWTTSNSGALGFRLRVSADGGTVYAGGFDGVIRAVNAGDGSAGWTALTFGEVFAPAIAAGMLFAQASTNFVYGIDQANGAIRWKVDTTNGAVPPGQSSNFPPTYANGMVFVPTGIVAPDRTSLENFIVALDAKTGAQLWKASLGRERATQPTVGGGLIFVQTEARLIAYGLTAPAPGPMRIVGPNWLFVPIAGNVRPACSE
ncbi:MAG: PQQ-binding-like beta-propeller repeat protein [Dehalococcoidia bacterium]